MDEVKVSLSLEEINTIIEALGKEQFIKVYKIIEKLHIEASKQLHPTEKKI